MEEFNEWNANSVTVSGTDKCFEEVPLIQTGVHKDVVRMAVSVIPRGLCKIVVIQNPEVASRFRAALSQDEDVVKHLTIPARVIHLEKGNIRGTNPKMQISDAFETQRTFWYDGPFDPFETNVFVIGCCNIIRVTCFDAHSWKKSEECSHTSVVADENTPPAVQKPVKRGRGRSRY